MLPKQHRVFHVSGSLQEFGAQQADSSRHQVQLVECISVGTLTAK